MTTPTMTTITAATTTPVMTSVSVADQLGKGWTFPPEVGPAGGFEWRSGTALVRQSILIILDTEPGERVMRPDFGCGLRRYLMEPNTPATRAAIAREIEAALRAWEPRIVVGTVDVTPTDDPSTVLVPISYTLTRDQSVDTAQVTVQVNATRGSQ
jgi:phage baseplate assembly protein W